MNKTENDDLIARCARTARATDAALPREERGYPVYWHAIARAVLTEAEKMHEEKAL